MTTTKKKSAVAPKKVDAEKVSEISQSVSSDDEMAEPETKNYNEPEPDQPNHPQPQQQQITAYAKFLDKFYDKVSETIGTLAYDRILGSPDVNIRVYQIMDIMKQSKGKYMPNTQADELLNIVAKAPYYLISDLFVDFKENQKDYIEVISPEQMKAYNEEEAAKAEK